jgi:hypothetical protein
MGTSRVTLQFVFAMKASMTRPTIEFWDLRGFLDDEVHSWDRLYRSDERLKRFFLDLIFEGGDSDRATRLLDLIFEAVGKAMSFTS